MYLWVIIATFLAALAAMGTSLRADIKQLYVEPQAENVVTKIYTQHRGMMTYAYKHLRNSDGTTDIRQGLWKPEDHPGYVPYGFQPNSGTSAFTSKIYCLDRNSAQHGAVPTECYNVAAPGEEPEMNCCAAPNAVIYLVTFGDIPAKWRDLKTGKPRPELMNAMKNTLGFIDGFGYVVHKTRDNPNLGENNKYDTLSTSYGVACQGLRSYFSIPQYVINDNDFKNMCLKNDVYCLIYMSTI